MEERYNFRSSMSNPYRAIAGSRRARADHNAGYVVRNQPMTCPESGTQPSIPPNDTFQSSNANQIVQAEDPWNDSWNWNVDQQSDTHQQRYIPSYPSQGHVLSNSMQDNYYQNVNGNNKSDMLNQHTSSDRDTPRSNANRQSIVNQTDTLPSFTNYNQNQQYPILSLSSSVKSSPLPSIDHRQWPTDQQAMNTSYIQQRQLSLNQKDQALLHPPLSNSYNWDKPEQPKLPVKQNWQSQVEACSGMQDSLPKDIQNFDDTGNQGSQNLSQQFPSPQIFVPPTGNTGNEHPTNWSSNIHTVKEPNNWAMQNNAIVDQWQGSHPEALPKQVQETQVCNSDSGLNPWSQTGHANPYISQEQQQGNVQNDSKQWLHESADSNLIDNNVVQNENRNTSIETDWQHTHSILSHRTSQNVSNVESHANSPIKPEPYDNSQKSISSSVTNVTLSNDSVTQPKSDSVKVQQENLPTLSEDTLNVSNSENVFGHVENRINSSTDGEANPSLDDMVPAFGQLNLNKVNKHTENHGMQIESHLTGSMPEWSQQASGTYSHEIRSNITPDKTATTTSNYTATLENSHLTDCQAVMIQEHVMSTTCQTISKSSENIPQSGYDQWYNQNTVSTTLGCEWRMRNQESKWTTDENTENCENIQQPMEFVNVEVLAPTLQERDIYGSHDSINKETLDNDPKLLANLPKDIPNLQDFRHEVNNIEVPSTQHQPRGHQSIQAEQAPDNYEFASNDRNTFLETGELTDSHQEHETTPPSQDDENDEVPNDIPFLREVPGQSSSTDARRNDPTGQEGYIQTSQRLPDPRRNDPSGQEQSMQIRNINDRIDRRDVPPGQERSAMSRGDSDALERRNDPSGRERSLPPQQSRNNPSGEERFQSQSQLLLESSEAREIPGRGNELDESIQPSDGRLIPSGASPNEIVQPSDERTNGRIVTGSQEVPLSIPVAQDQASDTRSKREEAVGASIAENQGTPGTMNRRDSYEDVDDDSGNSRDDSRERRRDNSLERRRYDYERKSAYYDREREYVDDYYYDRRRAVSDIDRSYNSRDEFDRRDISYRDDDRKHHSRDDLDRHAREEMERRVRNKDDLDDREGRRRPDDNRRDRGDDSRRRSRESRDYDPRYPRERDYLDRDRRRDDRRSRRYEDYDRDTYRREYYEDPYGRSSRPSSRSSYNDRDRDSYYARTGRDPYYGYNGYVGYDYGTHYGNNYYAYFENLRRTNPAAYAEWYHKYYATQHQQHIGRSVSSYPEDRASVHSGRSSCDERTTGEKHMLPDIPLEDSAITSARMTPTKFSTSHAYGCFSIGSLIHVHPSYPADGERAKVDIFRLDNLLLHDPVARDLRAYPGPLIKGVTHKKTIIEYCDNKIKKAAGNEEMLDPASYILLYELMIMLIQQNGNVVGVDIAALLLRNKDVYPYDSIKNKYQDTGRRESVISQQSGATGVESSNQDTSLISDKYDTTKQKKTVEQMTDEFRNTLLYGLVQEALENAMSDGLWGHALFLASKLDKRTHASVMTRFANSLPSHDPLQTLYQLHSGRVPAIVTCATDPRWDDWRPHLAMIISNTSANPEINRRSIMTLGDTLSTRGDIYAAHFCYILAQIDFGNYGDNGVKLVLIGSNHHKPYSEFMTTEAVMLTEIYEYARNLSEPTFTLVDLQTFKFDMAKKMVDYGLIEKSLLYIEQIAVNIVNEPSKYKKSFIGAVYSLGDKIKYHDPICKDSIEDATNLTWLNNLLEIVGKCQAGEIIEENSYTSQMCTGTHSNLQNSDIHETKQQQSQWNVTQVDYVEGPTSMMDIAASNIQSDWQPLSLPSNFQDTHEQTIQYGRNNEECNQYSTAQTQDYWNQQAYYQANYGNNDGIASNWQHSQMTHTPHLSEQTDVDSSQQQEKWNYEPTPAISMTPSSGRQYDPLEELDALETPRQVTKPTTDSKKPAEKINEKKTSNSSGSWFGGLFSKLAPKPKNQMILPDDSNPTIVWDPVAKKWTNKEDDADSGSTTLGPPPKASDIMFRAPSTEQAATLQSQPFSTQSDEPPSANGSKLGTGNIYKLPKVRNMRANYIDVMNPSGLKSNATPANVPTPLSSPLIPMATSSPQVFVPAPVNDPSAPMDFLTLTSTPVAPTSNNNENTSQGLSRWSSTSSLSREVQSYTMRDPRLQRNKGPMMFNSNETKDGSVKNIRQKQISSPISPISY